MEYFILDSSNINLIDRMDYNYWVPRDAINKESESIRLIELVGKDNITTSAFYPSITPFYQSLETVEEDSLPFLRVYDVRKGMLNFENTVFLNTDLLDSLSKNIKRVSPGDIVITKGGEYIGEASLVPSYYPEYSICRDLIAIKTKESLLSGAYISTFFQTAYGKNELIRTRSVQGQPHLTLNKLYDIEIPIFDEEFQQIIDNYWAAHFRLIDESDAHLSNAIQLLDNSLLNLLANFETQPVEEMLVEKKDLIGRMDVDFYEKKWSKLVESLENEGISFHEIEYIKEDIDISNPNMIYKYITLSDIDERSGIVKEVAEKEAYTLPDRAKRKIQFGDVLVSSLKGSKSKIGLIEKADDNLVASTGFYVVRDSFLNPQTIYLLFRSKYYEMFIEQMSSGAIMSSITDKYFKKLRLPNISNKIQDSIAEEVNNYFEKREEAFEALRFAKEEFELKLL